jgi:hypothetical protein
LFGQVLSLDGQQVYEGSITGAAKDGPIFGPQLARQIIADAGPKFLADIKSS